MYETLDSKDRPNVYDELKITGNSQYGIDMCKILHMFSKTITKFWKIWNSSTSFTFDKNRSFVSFCKQS